METLSSLEFLLQAGLVAAALLVALWSARKSFGQGAASPRTGEIVWSIVAITVLVGVITAVRSGGGHGG